jgi:protein-L-isoaspartate O-methyltransferase
MAQVETSEIEWKGRTGPFSLLVRPGVFSPTSTSRTLADALEIGPDDTVIDVGCGSGVLAFVAAKLGAKKVYGCDLSGPAVEMAVRNAERLGLSDVCEFRQGDLLEPMRDVRAPDDLAAVTGWFQDVPAGGPTGAELPRKLLETIGDTLAPGGRLYLPTGTLQDENAILAAARRVFGDNIEPVLERTFPLPDLVAKATATARLMKDGLLKLHQRGSRLLWELRVWRCVRLSEP